MPPLVETAQLSKLAGDISLTASRDGIVLIRYLHLNLRLVNCLSIKPTFKTIIKSIYPVQFSRAFVRKTFCKLLSKHLRQSLLLIKFHALSIFFWTPLVRVWSMKIILCWEIFCFRHSYNIQATKASKHKTLMEIH